MTRTRNKGAGRQKRATAPRAKAPEALDALVAANAQALGLTVDPSWHDAVKFNLQLILRHAALIDEFPLADEAEPAPAFRA